MTSLGKQKITIRGAVSADVGTVFGFIQETAAYQQAAHEVIATEKILDRHLFGHHPTAECLIAEIEKEAIGFALFFHNFSTFLGKRGLFLEDLYVKPGWRGKGIGLQLCRALAKIAQSRDCGRMEWRVMDHNESAVKFYQKLGAQPLSKLTVQRLTRAEIEALAQHPTA